MQVGPAAIFSAPRSSGERESTGSIKARLSSVQWEAAAEKRAGIKLNFDAGHTSCLAVSGSLEVVSEREKH